VPVLEAVTFGVFAEAQRGVSTGVFNVRRAWNRYVWLRGVEAQNADLRRQLDEVRVQYQERRALADRAGYLEGVLALRDRSNLQTAAAEVIASSASPDFRTLTIDKGTNHALKRDMAVIAGAGAVGRIVVPSPGASKIQLLIDRNAAAGALVERSRAQGVALGTGEDRLRLEYVSEASDVVVGDLVVTSGIDGIFPKGFTIGHVDAVEKSGTAYKRITIKPEVNFSSLETVLVVLTPTPAKEAAAEVDKAENKDAKEIKE